MWFLNFSPWVFIIAAGLDPGVLGLFAYNAATALFGSYARVAHVFIGCGAVWQLLRQILL